MTYFCFLSHIKAVEDDTAGNTESVTEKENTGGEEGEKGKGDEGKDVEGGEDEDVRIQNNSASFEVR